MSKSRYIILTDQSPDDLAAAVAVKIAEGWVPVGGLCVAPEVRDGAAVLTWAQAMTY